MAKLEHDAKGFTCECGLRNDYPAYANEHRNVRLLYTCQCNRQFILFRGTVRKAARDSSEVLDSEAFGD